MDERKEKPSIYSMPYEKLVAWLAERGWKNYQAEQVWHYLYRQRVADFSEMIEVKEACRNLLADHFKLVSFATYVKQEAVDGTTKYLFKLSDGNLIETVLMRHGYGLSVCVTTQVGCNIGCSFCASGLLTKKRNLTSGEIVEQILQLQRQLDCQKQGEKLSHIVVMGIGEPFDNFDNVVDFLRIITDHKGLAIGSRKITVSTSGLVDKIYQFADANLRVHLAISLHAATDELRTAIMKLNRRYPIDQLCAAIHYYLRTNKRIMLEYILLKEVNDQEIHALELAQLAEQFKQRVTINLIPYNPVDEHDHYQRSKQEDVDKFYDLLKQQQINCTVRQEHGTDIDAACGQLRSKQLNK